MIGCCHCRAVTFEVSAAPAMSYRCNCSYCARRGWQHAYAGGEDFRLLSGAEVLTSYGFDAQTTQHFFCSVCGIHTHFYSTYTDPPHYAYSLACCDDFEAGSVPVERLDGKSI